VLVPDLPQVQQRIQNYRCMNLKHPTMTLLHSYHVLLLQTHWYPDPTKIDEPVA